MRPLLVVCVTVSIALLLGAGGLLVSSTPLGTISTFQMSHPVSSVAWSPDSQDFAAVTFGQELGTLTIWRTRDSQKLLTSIFSVPPPGTSISLLAWAPDGTSLAMAWSDGNVKIWKAKAGNNSLSWSQNVSFSIGGRQGRDATGLAWSAASNHLLISYSDGLLAAWDIQHERLLAPILAPQVAGEKGSILSLSPHGTRAIISDQQTGNSGQVYPSGRYAIWDISTNKESPLLSQNGKSAESMISVAWSPDGKRLATVDTANTTRLWNAENGKLLGPSFPLFDHANSRTEEYADADNSVTALAWSPNGKYLLSGNSPGQVILQNVL